MKEFVELGGVLELWRYPVKSLRGESCASLPFEERGAEGDRRFALGYRDGKIASGKDSRRFRRTDGLFGLGARLVDGTLRVTDDHGRELGAKLGDRDSAIRAALGVDVRTIEEKPLGDAERIEHHDMAPVHLLTTGSLRWLADRLGVDSVDPRRFRPNLVLEVSGRDPVEFNWTGFELSIGADLRLEVIGAAERCRMVGLPQGELGTNRRLLAELGRASKGHFGVYARVVRGGTARRGDPVRRLA